MPFIDITWFSIEERSKNSELNYEYVSLFLFCIKGASKLYRTEKYVDDEYCILPAALHVLINRTVYLSHCSSFLLCSNGGQTSE
jgi:hypothetical protein